MISAVYNKSLTLCSLFLLWLHLKLIILSPGSIDTGSTASPPEVYIFVVLLMTFIMKHRTQATHEVCIDELTSAFPPKILII